MAGASFLIRAVRSLSNASTVYLVTSNVRLASFSSFASRSVKVLRLSAKAVSLVLASSGFSSASFLRSLASSALTATVTAKFSVAGGVGLLGSGVGGGVVAGLSGVKVRV